MKTILSTLLSLLPAALAVAVEVPTPVVPAASSTPPVPSPLDSIRIVAAAPVPTNVLSRVQGFARSNFPVQYVLDPAPAPDPAVDLEEAAALSGGKTNDFLKVVLCDAVPADTRHAFFNPTNRVLVVNTAVLRHDDPETFARRLDRQMARGIGFSLGLKPCPSPMCGLYPYKNLSELDQIGRGPCPPCHFSGMEKAKAAGVVLKFPSIRPRAGVPGLPTPPPAPPALPAPQP